MDYLIKGARTELEKFRVIFRWITNNIKYDVGFLDGRGKGGTEPEDVLRNGFSVCAGYSKLYEYLCRLVAMLEAVRTDIHVVHVKNMTIQVNW